MSFADLILTLNSISAGLAGWLGTALVQGTLLAALTWCLLRGPLKRVPAGVHAALWLIVIVKFLVPLGPAQPFSLASVLSAGTGWVPGAAVTAPAATDAAPVEPGLAIAIIDRSGAKSPAAASTPVAAAFPLPSLTSLLVVAYVGLVGWLLTWRTCSYLSFRGRCLLLPHIHPSGMRDIEMIARQLGLRRAPDVRVSDTAGAPFILGAWRPLLVLPERQVFCPAEFEAVVLHELAHVRRGDLWARRLQWLAGTLLFFWPVVAWVNRRIDLLREVACDAWALRHSRLSAGDYARCLLKAVRSAAVPRFSYAPSAMASHRSHVERRIEVILQNSGFRNSRMLGFGSVALLAGWSAFALGGAAPLNRPLEDVSKKPAAGEQTMMFVTVDDADGAVTQDVIVQGMPIGTPVEGMSMFHMVSDDGAGAPVVFMATAGAPMPEMLSAFLKRHPTADVDGDGALSNGEYQAYLIAATLSEPAKVLERFPKADLNGDGALDANEAAKLVTGAPCAPTAARFRTMTLGGAPAAIALHGGPAGAATGTWVTATPGEDKEIVINAGPGGDAQNPVQVKVIRTVGPDGKEDLKVEATGTDAGSASDGTTATPRVLKMRVNAPEGGQGELKVDVVATDDESCQAGTAGAIAVAGMPMKLDLAMAGDCMPPQMWIDQNISTAPTSKQVAQYLQLATESSLAAFLETHPDADANADGKLTEAERTTFLDSKTSAARKKMLERFPGADTNADGELTHDELRAYFKAKGAMGMHGGPATGTWQLKVEKNEGLK